MIRILLATLVNAMQCRPHQGSGRAVVLFALEETYGFGGDKSVYESSNSAITGGFNLDQFTQSGRCRAVLIPT